MSAKTLANLAVDVQAVNLLSNNVKGLTKPSKKPLRSLLGKASTNLVGVELIRLQKGLVSTL